MTVSPEDIKGLHKYEILLLKTLERLMKKYLWVPEENIRKSSRLSEAEMEYRLGQLMEKNMVKSSSVPYRGYQFTFSGYDALAVTSLVRNGTVTALGSLIGVGKESSVYEALGTGALVIKLHCIGQRSFQSARLNRGFMPEWSHFPWIFASTYSARQEYEALKALRKGGVNVPIPIAVNRNVVAMSYIAGVNLHQAVLEEPREIFDAIFANIKKAYELGFIHNDLSEFNVMTDGDSVWVIDWPQWIEPTHQNADDILLRDISNITTYFAKKYNIVESPEKIRDMITGKTDA